MIRLVYNDKLMRIAKQLLGGELREPVAGGARMGSQGPAWPNGPIDPARIQKAFAGSTRHCHSRMMRQKHIPIQMPIPTGIHLC